MANEPLLDEKNNRFVLFPIEHNDIWNYYKLSVANFWTAEEIDLTRDITEYNSLTKDERHFINRILSFFAASDGIVNKNLAENFLNDVKYIEGKFFYGFQIAVENIHSETYSLLIDTYIKDKEVQRKLFDGLNQFASLREKKDWSIKYIDNGSFQEQLIAFAAVEGIFFSSSFCGIFWLRDRGMLKGLCQANELIARDEGLHRDFACHLYKNHIKNKLDKSKVEEIILDAVDIERRFVRESLPYDLVQMNSKLMCEYVEFVADHLLVELGLDKVFNTKNPFPFMETISMQGHTNFFERHVTEYAKAGSHGDSHKFNLNEDF